jgi:hypothetical protein
LSSTSTGDIKDKANEMKTKMTTAVSTSQAKMKDSFSTIQNQLQTYGNQIGDYLKTMNANVEDYKFAVEKIDNGLTVDVRFKATIKAQNTPGTTTTSTPNPGT